MRSGSWKLTGERNKAVTLVNLTQDIGEAKNLLPTESARAEELMKAHTQWAKSLGGGDR